MTAAAIGVVAAVAVFVARALPPARIPLQDEPPDGGIGTIAGAVHIHSRRSDGNGTPDEIAEAAAQAGLQFVILTDHGDATRTPDPPVYRSGVLCLDGVEISTSNGHYVALGLPAAPYPLGGDGRDVVDDVRRLGGFGVIAHPDSPKASLRWTDWEAPFDAVEIVNPDTSWRVHLQDRRWRERWFLLSRFLTYPFRAEETIASLLVDSPGTLERYDAMTQVRPIVAIAGVDAHGHIGIGDIEPGDARLGLPIPGYEASFRALTIRVTAGRPFTGDAGADAATLLAALRGGRHYIAATGLASPPSFAFTATPASPGMTALDIRSNTPAGFVTILRQRGRAIETRREPSFSVTVPDKDGPYRVEIRAGDRPDSLAWVFSNPIWTGPGASAVGATPAAPVTVSRRRPLFDGKSAAGWGTETDPTSLAALDVAQTTTGAELRLRFGLSGGSAINQFAALVVETPGGLGTFDHLTFSARAERPMRISVQARATREGADPDRWQRSIYLDEQTREHTVRFSDMRPIATPLGATPRPESVYTLVFVVELTNNKPGSSGRLWIRSAELRKLSPS